MVKSISSPLKIQHEVLNLEVVAGEKFQKAAPTWTKTGDGIGTVIAVLVIIIDGISTTCMV